MSNAYRSESKDQKYEALAEPDRDSPRPAQEPYPAPRPGPRIGLLKRKRSEVAFFICMEWPGRGRRSSKKLTMGKDSGPVVQQAAALALAAEDETPEPEGGQERIVGPMATDGGPALAVKIGFSRSTEIVGPMATDGGPARL